MQKQLNYYLKALQYLVFPHQCKGCGADYISINEYLCTKCIAELPVTMFLHVRNNPVEKIFAGRIKIENAGALYYFTKMSLMQHLIFQLKYNGDKNAGYFLGRQLGKALSISGRFDGPDIILPIPLHPRRAYERGYNQASLIAEGIKMHVKGSIIDHAVIRKEYTKTQTQENRTGRWENMMNSFEVVAPEALENKHILLVDDVVTTGASLEACGASILKIPGTKLSIATVAYTI